MTGPATSAMAVLAASHRSCALLLASASYLQCVYISSSATAVGTRFDLLRPFCDLLVTQLSLTDMDYDMIRTTIQTMI